MEWYQIMNIIVGAVVSVLSLLGFGTAAKFYWEDKHKKKVEATEEAKTKAKESRQKEIQDAVSGIFDPFAERIEKKVNDINDRLSLNEKSDQALLRNSLMGLYYSCWEKGYRTEDDSKNYREMHKAYNDIGGNSFIDHDISQAFESIPLVPNDYSSKQIKNKKKGGAGNE